MRPRTTTAAPVLACFIGWFTAGCEADLPPCDPVAARNVVVLDAPSDVSADDGVPMYEGQALLHVSCGAGSLCHATDATGELRGGAPSVVSFDVAPACIGRTCSPDEVEQRGLEASVAHVRSHARRFYDLVDRGRMPPGAAGARVVTRAGAVRELPSNLATLSDGALVPGLETRAGRLAFGNWLACGAPVVQTVRDPDPSHFPGDACATGGSDVGDCVTRLPFVRDTIAVCAGTLVPSYDALFDRIIAPLCAESCHGYETPRASLVRLGDRDATFATLLDQAVDDPLVIPGNATGSHIVHHLEGLFSLEVMPPGLITGRLSHEATAAMREWINAGALRSCP